MRHDDLDATMLDERAATTLRASMAPAAHVLAGRYELSGLLGAGGMGAVYRAFDRELGEAVALKMLRGELAGSPPMLARFREEVRLARRVTHPNVARMFDIGADGDARFLTMELIEGESLAAILEREGALSVGRVVEIATQACAGLDAAHRAGVVHLDFKPDNVLVRSDGHALVADFGIARALCASVEAERRFAGTPAYAAPEQVEVSPDVDARADVYAMGVMLFECLTGALPFDGQTAEQIARARLTQPPPDPRTLAPELPEAVASLVLRCLARDPAARYAAIADVAEGLGTAAAAGARLSGALRQSASARRFDRSVAVLRLSNAGDEGDAYLADTLTEDLTDLLSTMQGIRVRPIGRAHRDLGPGRDARAVGRELGVQVVVDGSVRRAGDLVRVSLRAVTVEDGFQLWAMRSQRRPEEFFAFGDEAAAAIAKALASSDSPSPRQGEVPPEATDLYLRGRHLFLRGWIGRINEACDLLERAHAIAPDCTRIAACYGRALVRKHAFDAPEAGSRAQALLEAIDDAEARLGLAALHIQQGEGVSGARLLSRCLDTAPALAEALDWRGRLLIEVGPVEEGKKTLRRALELEPLLALVPTALARALALEGDWPAAVDIIFATDVSDAEAPTHWMDSLRFALWHGDVERARTIAERFNALTLQPRVGAMFGAVYAVLTERTSATVATALHIERSVPRTQSFFAQLRAEVHGALGETDRALDALADADGHGLFDIVWLEGCPVLAGVRRAPAAAPILARVRGRADRTRAALGL